MPRLSSPVCPGSVAVVIPACNEEPSLPRVLRALPRDDIDRIVVVDNGSTDGTARVARAGQAEVVQEPVRGYGRACQAGLAALRSRPPDVVVFLDADFSDHPEELSDLIAPILDGRADLVIGARVASRREPGAIAPQALWGNRLVTTLLRWIWGGSSTDLGPFRAIRWSTLERLALRDPNFGWNVEMQIRALETGLRILEVPVSYRRRTGTSKISGTLSGTLRAGAKILWTVLVHGIRRGSGLTGRRRAGSPR